MTEPIADRPHVPAYGQIPDTTEGMVDWAWAEERGHHPQVQDMKWDELKPTSLDHVSFEVDGVVKNGDSQQHDIFVKATQNVDNVAGGATAALRGPVVSKL